MPAGRPVGEEFGDLVDQLAELVELGEAAELAVDAADVVDLAAEGLDGGRVHGAGDSEPGA